MSDMNVQSLLAQMRVMEAQSKMGVKPVSSGEGLEQTSSVDFGNLLKNSIEAVNETSLESRRVADAFERGKTNNQSNNFRKILDNRIYSSYRSHI